MADARATAVVGAIAAVVVTVATMQLSFLAYANQSMPTCDGRAATIVGTPGDDFLIGTEGDDVIAARGGSDRIEANGGNDVVCAGPGDDFVLAGDGDDLVFGGEGADVIDGGDGADLIDGGPDPDRLRVTPGDRVARDPSDLIEDARKASDLIE